MTAGCSSTSSAADVVQLRREVTDELAQAWHDRMLDRLVGIIRIKPWGDLHEATQAGYRVRVAWLVGPVVRIIRRHAVAVMVGGPDFTDLDLRPFAELCRAGCGPYECTRAADHPPGFHASGDGHVVLAVWTGASR